MNPRPHRKEREKLAMSVGLSLVQVTNWYKAARVRLGCANYRVRLETKQRDILLNAYSEDQHPCYKKRAKLAKCIGISELRVRRWFLTSRSKAKSRAAELLQEPNL